MDITIFHNGEAGEGEWPRGRILALCRDLKLTPAYLDAKDDDALDRLEQARGPVAADRIDIDLEDHSLRVDDELAEHGDSIRLRLRRRPIQVVVPKVLP